MILKLYRTNSEPNRVHKELTNEVVLNGKLNGECDILNPTIAIKYHTLAYELNYAYIPEFKRYYNITGIVVNNGIMYISFHVDVLMTYESDIKASTGIITRNRTGNDNIVDDMVITTQKPNRQVRKIGNSFTKSEKYILQLGG